MLDQVRAAAADKAAAQAALDQANAKLHEAIREAKEQGFGEGELAEAAGVTRQRVWQVTRG